MGSDTLNQYVGSAQSRCLISTLRILGHSDGSEEGTAASKAPIMEHASHGPCYSKAVVDT
jgi:hypothetical protein